MKKIVSLIILTLAFSLNSFAGGRGAGKVVNVSLRLHDHKLVVTTERDWGSCSTWYHKFGLIYDESLHSKSIYAALLTAQATGKQCLLQAPATATTGLS